MFHDGQVIRSLYSSVPSNWASEHGIVSSDQLRILRCINSPLGGTRSRLSAVIHIGSGAAPHSFTLGISLKLIFLHCYSCFSNSGETCEIQIRLVWESILCVVMSVWANDTGIPKSASRSEYTNTYSRSNLN
jgi:hypothetical protein